MISLSQISKQYGSKVLFRDSGFQIAAGNKIGLVGPNGAGKTTIFRILSGEETADSGTVSIPDRIKISYFSQEVGEMAGCTALEEAKKGAGEVATWAVRLAELEKILQDSAENPISDDEMMAVVEEYGQVQLDFEQRGGYNLESRAREVLGGLGIMTEDQDKAVETFSGGWKMRIALARVLIAQPDVLLMDEPTNHLDLESVIWIEEWLKNYKGALVMTSHDREFMNRIVNRIVEVANYKITEYTGNYDYYERERGIRHEQLLSSFKRQQDMLAKEEEFIARFAARASHAAQVQSRVKKLDKIERIEIPPEQQAMQFEFPNVPRSGNDVVKMEGLGKTWRTHDSKEKKVFQGVTGMIRRLEKIAVVGVNGAGKSTFLKVICGQTEATEGMVQIGASVKVGYFSQHSIDILNPKNTVLEEMYARLPEAGLGYIRNLLGAFLFTGDEVHKRISSLSGGEKSRLVLATIMVQPVNFLILDEPTNHLDILSREILMDGLKRFEGTIVIVSHDRYFLKQIANRVIEVGHGELRTYPGTYGEYLESIQP